jgi:hypothetical protein
MCREGIDEVFMKFTKIVLHTEPASALDGNFATC